MSGKTAKPRPLKIGIVCEGQRGCAETQVFPHLVKLLCPGAVLEIVPTGNRPRVLAKAPTVAKKLFDEGCATVFVVWDVFPEWRDQGGTTDCKRHCKDLEASIQAFDGTLGSIFPVAIREELEAWLLCDADALMAAIGPLERKKAIPHETNPDGITDPKTVLSERFKLGRGSRYNPSLSAGKIAANLTSIRRLERSQSFKRFADEVRRLCPQTA
jgi:hypothetical protein